MEDGHLMLFQKQISNLSKLKKAVIEGPKTKEVSGFVMSTFWLNYTLGVNSLSNAVTKLAVLLTEPPLPDLETIRTCVMEIEASYMSMVNAFISLPKSIGTNFCKVLDNATQAILIPLHSYFVKINKKPSDPTQAEVVGMVWRGCEAVASLPKDNREAVVRALNTERDLIKDALEELQEEVKAGRAALKTPALVSSSWSGESELRLVEGGLRLVGLVEGGLAKVSSSLSSDPRPPPPATLDRLASAAALLSPALDDLVTSLYPPFDFEPIDLQVSRVVAALDAVLDSLPTEPWAGGLRRRLSDAQAEIRGLVAVLQAADGIASLDIARIGQ